VPSAELGKPPSGLAEKPFLGAKPPKIFLGIEFDSRVDSEATGALQVIVLPSVTAISLAPSRSEYERFSAIS
jgi:hypothetical protein